MIVLVRCRSMPGRGWKRRKRQQNFERRKGLLTKQVACVSGWESRRRHGIIEVELLLYLPALTYLQQEEEEDSLLHLTRPHVYATSRTVFESNSPHTSLRSNPATYPKGALVDLTSQKHAR